MTSSSMSATNNRVLELFAENSIKSVTEIGLISRLIVDEVIDRNPIVESSSIAIPSSAKHQNDTNNASPVFELVQEELSLICHGQDGKTSHVATDETSTTTTTTASQHRRSKHTSHKNFDRSAIIAEQEVMATTFLNFLLYDDDDDEDDEEEEEECDEIQIKTQRVEHITNSVNQKTTFQFNYFRRHRNIENNNNNDNNTSQSLVSGKIVQQQKQQQRANKYINDESLFYMRPEKTSYIFRLPIDTSEDDSKNSSSFSSSSTSASNKQSYVPSKLFNTKKNQYNELKDPNHNSNSNKNSVSKNVTNKEHSTTNSLAGGQSSNNNNPQLDVAGNKNDESSSSSSNNNKQVHHHNEHDSYLHQLLMISKLNPFHFIMNIRSNNRRQRQSRYRYNNNSNNNQNNSSKGKEKEQQEKSKIGRRNIFLLQ